MRRIVYSLFLLLLAIGVNAQQAKYVFYFIGDGMGINQIVGTEMYKAANQGRIGVEPLLFASFPVATVAATYSASNPITDSAAGGTALATGVKTYNSAIGVDKDKKSVQSIAEMAKQAGKKVGVTTSVSVDHATPASFYAHQERRQMYYEIATELPKSGFDFFAGSGFLRPNTTIDGKEAPSIYPMFDAAGYVIARGVDEYKAKAATTDKMILIQPAGATREDCLPYAVDRKPGDLTLAQITESAIDFLTKDKKSKGFFLMVEGGKIDWACHANDIGTTFEEVIDMDEAVKVAYEFYKKHPKETLIVISADHETGGLSMGNSNYWLYLDKLKNQKCSIEDFSRIVTDYRRDNQGKASWEGVKKLLSDNFGFFTSAVELNWDQEKKLRDAYEESFVKNNIKFDENLYSQTDPIAAAARDVMADVAHIGWSTRGHSAGYVPVFAIGAGSKLFTNGKLDNIDIPRTIAKAAGYKYTN